MILLDTDHFSVLMDARHARHARLVERLAEVDEPVQIPVVSIEEQLRAWLAQIRRVRDPHTRHAGYPFELGQRVGRVHEADLSLLRRERPDGAACAVGPAGLGEQVGLGCGERGAEVGHSSKRRPVAIKSERTCGS